MRPGSIDELDGVGVKQRVGRSLFLKQSGLGGTCPWTVPTAVVVGASLWITSAHQPATLQCSAVFPAPEGCTAGAGGNITLVMSAILFGVFTALLLVGDVVQVSRRIKLLRIVMVAIISATLVGPMRTLGSFGCFLARHRALTPLVSRNLSRAGSLTRPRQYGVSFDRRKTDSERTSV